MQAGTAAQFEQLLREFAELKTKLASATNVTVTPTPTSTPTAPKVAGGMDTTPVGQSPDQSGIKVSTAGSGPTAVSFGNVGLMVDGQALNVFSNAVRSVMTNELKRFKGVSAPIMTAPGQVYIGDNARNVIVEVENSKKTATANQAPQARKTQVGFPSPKVTVASAGGFVTAGPNGLREVLPYNEHVAVLAIQEAGYRKLVSAARRGY